MNRKTIFARLAPIAFAIMTVAIIFIAGTHVTTAQITQCISGSYTVDLTNLPISSDCFPLHISTNWGANVIVDSNYPGPGIYTALPPVPPGTRLNGITICGGGVPAVPGQYPIACGPNCIFCVRVCTTPANCLVIKLYPGPCPGLLLPCP